jgi:hypothetical protein
MRMSRGRAGREKGGTQRDFRGTILCTSSGEKLCDRVGCNINIGDIRNDRLSNSPRLQYQQEETCGVLARNWLKTRFTIKYQSYSLKVRQLNDGVVNY